MTTTNMPDIVRGHEVWLEHDMQHVHIKDTVECKLLFGHNMAIDGLAEIENVKASVFDPFNEKHGTIPESSYAVKIHHIITEKTYLYKS